MELILVRHGIAADREGWKGSDEERALTPEGVRRFRRAAAGLATLADPPTEILTSPVLRARQTAEIAAGAWNLDAVSEAPALAWGSLDDLQAELSRRPAEAVLALVGHEPHLSELLARLVGSECSDRLAFKKGGAARVSLDGPLSRGGRLIWLLPPRVLRRLGEDSRARSR